MLLSKGEGERLYFFFAGHGLTARVSNRDENALLTTGFNAVNTDHSIALRSLWEFFETTQFRDQFFFVDACRNVPPWGEARVRDRPLDAPAQPRPRHAARAAVHPLRDVAGVEGGRGARRPRRGARRLHARPCSTGSAATARPRRGRGSASTTRSGGTGSSTTSASASRPRSFRQGTTAELLQVPQDAGSRGVPGRDRDAVIVSLPADRFGNERLEVQLEPDSVYPKAGVVVLNAIGAPVAEAVRLTGSVVTFELPPRTYALRAVAPDFKDGLLQPPVDLYGKVERQLISLDPLEKESKESPSVVEPKPDPRIVVKDADPLTVIEVRDETGDVKAVWQAASELPPVAPGFYRLRLVGPEASSEEQFVTLTPGEVEKVELDASPAAPFAAELGRAVGASKGRGKTFRLKGLDPIAWAEPSTFVTLAVGAAIAAGPASNGAAPAGLGALGVTLPAALLNGEATSGVAVYAVAAGTGDGADAIDDVRLRLWAAGDPVPSDDHAIGLDVIRPGLGAHVATVEPGAYWLSLERGGTTRSVISLTVLNGRLATLVGQVEPEGPRLYQYQPTLKAAPTSTPAALRRLEYLERSLLGGHLDAAQPLALEIAETAAEDPFAGCLCGYVLLRLGMLDELNEVIGKVVAVAPSLSDVYILRGEHAAATGGTAGRQSFADATAAGIPVFAEGLTRLVEGLRAHDLLLPRGSIVRYLFQRHVRGSMWSIFTPRRFEPGTLIVTGADTGFEA